VTSESRNYVLIRKPAFPVESGNPEFLVTPEHGVQCDCGNQIQEPGFPVDSGTADFQVTPETRSSGWLMNPYFRVFPGNESLNPKFGVAPGTRFRVLGFTRNSGGDSGKKHASKQTSNKQ